MCIRDRDMRVGDILPQFAAAPFDQITLFHLLTHTSGLQPDGGCFPEEDSPSPWAYIEEAAKNWKAGEKFDWLTPVSYTHLGRGWEGIMS